jgi:hypothetical protein
LFIQSKVLSSVSGWLRLGIARMSIDEAGVKGSSSRLTLIFIFGDTSV